MHPFRTALFVTMTALTAQAETRIHVTGMTRKSESQVLELLGGRLEHVTRSDASPSRADDAAFLLRQVLHKDGYADVVVTWKIVNRSEIRLIVNEGIRLSLGKVTINGVTGEDNTKLVKLYSLPAEKDRKLSSGDPPFREEDVETGLGYLRQDLNAQGYWAAKVTLKSKVIGADGLVEVVIDVEQGALFTIAAARIASPDGRGTVQTRTTTAPFVGKPATTGSLNGMRQAVEEAFVSRGYPDAKITMGRSLEGSRFIPEFSVDLGTRVRLNRVNIEGLVKTNPERVRGRLKSLEGDWYDEAAMNKRLRGFLATGAFSSVRVDKVPAGENQINATLHLEEAPARQVSFGLGADSYQGPLFRATYADRNLWGELLGFSTGIELSGRGILGETRITDPWMFGRDVSGTARLYALIYGREGYTSFETGLEGKLSRKFDHYTLEALVGYSIVNTSEEGLDPEDLGETVYSHPRLRVTNSLDFRDSPILPTKGWHLEAPTEIGAAVGELSTAYFSGGMTGGWYHQINKTYQIGFGGEWGVVVPSGGGDDLPIDLRLFNGGSRSVRSFPERELGPSSHGYALGGQAMWNANAELIRTINGSVKGVLFMDAGALSGKLKDLGAAEIEVAVGLGIRLDLPIGPVRLEYGYNLTRDSGEPMGTLHFAIGAAF